MPKSKSKIEVLRKDAAAVGFYVGTYSPGDGVTRYRFFSSPRGAPVSYFSSDGVYTALGFKEASAFLAGLERARR